MDIQSEVKTGTTIFAATYSEGVVLAADTRASTGIYVANRVTPKIIHLTENASMACAGSMADVQAIANYVQYFAAQHQAEIQQIPPVTTIARFVQQLSYNNKNNLKAGLIVGGWDEKSGGQVFSIPMGGTMTKVPFAISGSGANYIYGFCDDNWRSDMSVDECVNFAMQAIAQAIGRDGSSGGGIRITVVNKDGQKSKYVRGNQIPLTYGELQQPA
eukprot:TRINITY_DN5052_c0_g1_i8.p2 TRINITY_DN5052_c0_g1~~TRINITY_DN5052_c0_g1_i8.p2  ORF type:complete len:216 (-),score=44.04 TRINITY_DN5052_c0_g1_i8:390-1037(-)